ncbi:cytochrome c biogenesis heme-transporting ATPase CcmA [Phocoenobacter skyensis]|uniref:Cytochrome c biogenesis heme-transporting ATPase CcmA n=1 Tax=Phocoenobacter skyensis TaxID=97481 RepID=A0A1H7YY39_9PAST|nr:cytochrome c biogenesis heme-transporting ATPase CcmA [Pasteurella skyensis]MDP8080124.1 cytochrome c biogenesis heme-transporting ATPase CcmA [Pasteurella skyensis]MDP8086108.1 cytochrome c biogenesis heme-transporting ATPase CcmA [Pasteurella skyensis]MDP8185808.1 cytochrome c biogenesis heme-transporting ATPase CcmA [Pasteurella skyensis]QLB22695.1 heme ABC transporter ATP-binding protein CcmA [Pasteurella skyensis]SEM51066.1 heme exporter protein A [Pasteurella skyensis]
MSNNNQLKVVQLCCQRGNKRLFSHLDFCWNAGDFVQVEGHNGIGKTSLLRILVGLAQPLSGEIFWNNCKIHKNREEYHHNLLYLGHLAGIKQELTAWENLQFYQKVTDCKQGDDILWDVLQKVGLFGREDIIASQLSAGQQKRIALARLWLSNAPLWILDEPFNAIDKQGVQVLTQLFEQHTQKGGIVILTSHQAIPSEKLKILQLEEYKYQDNYDDI